MITEKEAKEALKRLDDLRVVLRRYEKFRDKLEVNKLEGFGEARITIEKGEYNTSDLFVPYKVCMPWVLDEVKIMEKEIKGLELLFKKEE